MILYLLLCVLAILSVDANPTGAGGCLDTQASLQDFIYHHGGPDNPNAAASVIVSAESIVPGCTYSVGICAQAFKGFLLYAKTESRTRVGTFELPAPAGTAQHMFCNDAAYEQTVTHTNSNAKTNLYFKFKAPADLTEPVSFSSTVVFGPVSNWAQATSTALPIGSGSCPEIPTSFACPAVDDHSDHQHDHGDHGSDHGDHSDHNDHAAHAGGHSMTFNTDWNGIKVVFAPWHILSKAGYTASILMVICTGILFEVLQLCQARLDRRLANALKQRQRPRALTADSDLSPCCIDPEDNTKKHSHMHVCDRPELEPAPLVYGHGPQALRSLLYLARTFVSYFNMMVFMLLDVGLVVALLAGFGIGFFLFGRERSTTSGAGCHVCC